MTPFRAQKNYCPVATVGQARVCVFVFVSVCVCCEERRCGVVTLKFPKKNTYLSILKQTLYLTKTQQTEF